jgi:hypothetical protein
MPVHREMTSYSYTICRQCTIKSVIPLGFRCRSSPLNVPKGTSLEAHLPALEGGHRLRQPPRKTTVDNRSLKSDSRDADHGA